MDHYVTRADGKRSYYGENTAPNGEQIIKGPGAVFRNKIKNYGFSIADSVTFMRGGSSYRITKFVSDGDLKAKAIEMELGFIPNQYDGKRQWDPADISQHYALSKLRNLEVLNIHIKEVVDIISIGLGEMPKITIAGLDDAKRGSFSSYQRMDSAELSYEEFQIDITLKRSR